VHVLRNMTEAVEPGGLILDLQVIRPNPIVEDDSGAAVCEIYGEPLFRKADAASAAIDAAVRAGALSEEARDDHDVRTYYATGVELVDDFDGRERKLPAEALPQLRQLERCAVRERCRVRRLRVPSTS
jgi:uncharacterized protein YbjT (DUF2867 family)